MRSRQLNNTSPLAEPISFSNENIPGGIKLHIPEIRLFRGMRRICGLWACVAFQHASVNILQLFRELVILPFLKHTNPQLIYV